MKLTFKLPRFRAASASMAGASVIVSSNRLRNVKRWLRQWGPWLLVASTMFVMFAWLSIPTRAIAWRISHELKNRGYVVDVEDVSVSLLGGLTLENVRWTFEPSRPGEPPSTFVAEEIDVDVSLLKYLFGVLDVDVEGTVGDGAFLANYTRGEESSSFELEINDVPLFAIPKARQALNAPLLGTLTMKVELEMPENQFAKANGVLEVGCSACRIGDGETLMFVPGVRTGLLAKGVTIPEIDFGNVGGKMVFTDGVGETEGAIEAKSDDLNIQLSGRMILRDPFGRSKFDLVLKVDVSDSLQERSDSIRLLVQTAHPTTKLDPPEDGLGFRLTGPVAQPRFAGIKTKTSDERLRERREAARKRAEKRKKQREAQEKKKQEGKADPSDQPDEPAPVEGDEPRIGEALQIEPLPPAAHTEVPQTAAPTPAEAPGFAPSEPADSGGTPGGQPTFEPLGPEGNQPPGHEPPAGGDTEGGQQPPVPIQ